VVTAQHGHGDNVGEARGGAEDYAQGQSERQGHVGQVIVEQYPSEQVCSLGRVSHHVEHDLDVGREPGQVGHERPVPAPAAGQPAPQQRAHVGGQQAPRPRRLGVVHGQAVHVKQHGRRHVTSERRTLLLGVVALVQALSGPVREPSGIRRRGRGAGRRSRRWCGFHRPVRAIVFRV